MKVYARYFSEDGLNFRRDTILRFGDSWDVIGAAVLINPGSHRSQRLLERILCRCDYGATSKNFQRMVCRRG